MTAPASSSGRLARAAAIWGSVLLCAAAIGALAARLVPWLASMAPVADLAGSMGWQPTAEEAQALGAMTAGWVRMPAIIAFAVGMLLVVVAALGRSRPSSVSGQGAAPARDLEAWGERREIDEQEAESNAGKVVAVVVGAVAVVALAFMAVQWLGGDEQEQEAQAPAGSDVAAAPAAVDVVITEVVTSNGSIASDEDGDWSDYIELHNPTVEPVNLAGHFLSDDDDQPARWRLPEATIEPGGYLLVWASGKDRFGDDRALHTNFALEQDGEPVLLVAPDGETIIDRVEPRFLPRDVAWGIDPRDADRGCYFAVPTPGEPNVAECFDDLELGAPKLSVSSGFYDQPFGLTVTVDDPQATIIYTLDGSYPDLDLNPDRTLVYDGPLRIVDRTPEPERLARINTIMPEEGPGPPDLFAPFAERIDKATVVRVRSEYSAETVATYFVGPQMVRSTVPVVSLVLDEEFLFDDEFGIYIAGKTYRDYFESGDYDPDVGPGEHPANYNQRGRSWERPPQGQHRRAVVFEYCTVAGVCDFQRNIGLRIHGGATRTFEQKSLRLYARNDYGDRVFSYPFFADRAPTNQRRLLLRNSGNDQGRTMVMDAYLQGLMGDFRADTQAAQPVVVFINGEYWGLHNIRERYDEHYLELYYGADPDTVVALEGGLAFDVDGLAVLEELATRDPASDATLDWIQRQVDLDSWIDFLIAHLYAGNPDWPGRNERLWRQPDGPHAMGDGVLDGRWRWQIVDLDQMGGALALYDVDYDAITERLPVTDDITFTGGAPFMFNELAQHPAFVEQFVARYADLLNTSLRAERASSYLDEVVAEIAPEVPNHMGRWRQFDVEFWQSQLEQLDEFMRLRPDAVRRQLVERFALGSPTTVGVLTDPARGAVRINSVFIDPSTPGVDDPANWQGVYFDGMGVTLEAVAWSGSRFVRWEGLPESQQRDATDSRVTIVLDGPLEISAVFESA